MLLRKAEGNAILPPGIPLAEVEPEIQNSERFKLGTQPVVGALPVSIFNRRIESLVDEKDVFCPAGSTRGRMWLRGRRELKPASHDGNRHPRKQQDAGETLADKLSRLGSSTMFPRPELESSFECTDLIRRTAEHFGSSPG